GMSKGSDFNECENIATKHLKEEGSRGERKVRSRAINKLAVKVKLGPVEEDQRKKEWILVAWENNQWDIRHIIRKDQKIVLMEHWIQESQNVITEMIVKRCKGCNHNKSEKLQLCKEQIKRNSIVEVLPTRPHENGKRKLDLNAGAILKWDKRRK
ncbi:11936_t:CDS:2, partial [Gigaspora rosea]